MSQLIWMIDLIPNWFWTLVLWSGVLALVASYILGKIPFVAQYRLPLRIGGVIATIVGVYFYGVIANEAKWQAKVDQLKTQLEAAKQESKQANTVIEEKIVYKDRIIKEKAKKQIEYVDKVISQKEEVIKYVENCPVPKVIIDEINKAAAGEQK